MGFKRGGLCRQNPPTQIRGWQKNNKHCLWQATGHKNDGFPSRKNHAFVLARGILPLTPCNTNPMYAGNGELEQSYELVKVLNRHRKEISMAARTRQNVMYLRLSDDEKRILEAKTSLSIYRNPSAYLRALIIYGFTYDADYSYLHDYNVTLARIASSIHQIAKRVNTTGNIYRNDIAEVKELMNRVWLTHESMLSRQPSTNL